MEFKKFKMISVSGSHSHTKGRWFWKKRISRPFHVFINQYEDDVYEISDMAGLDQVNVMGGSPREG